MSQEYWLYLPGGEWEAKRYGETTERRIQGWHCLSHVVRDAWPIVCHPFSLNYSDLGLFPFLWDEFRFGWLLLFCPSSKGFRDAAFRFQDLLVTTMRPYSTPINRFPWLHFPEKSHLNVRGGRNFTFTDDAWQGEGQAGCPHKSKLYKMGWWVDHNSESPDPIRPHELIAALCSRASHSPLPLLTFSFFLVSCSQHQEIPTPNLYTCCFLSLREFSMPYQVEGFVEP